MGQTNAPNPVDLHREYLIDRVREALSERPELRMVALVIEKNAPELDSIVKSPAEIHRAEDGSISLLMTRDSAKQFLAQASPKVLDWLEDEQPGSIPVIHSARKAMRAGSIKYDAAY